MPAAGPRPSPPAGLLAFDRHCQHGPAPTSWLVGQCLYPVLQKSPRPLVDDAMGDPDSVDNLDHGHAISQQEYDLTPSGLSHRDGGRALLRCQRLAFVRCETDRE
jgi:hypothetical protein